MSKIDRLKSVNKAISLLKCFSPQVLELSVSEISEEIGIHRVTAYRLLEALVEAEFLKKSDNTRKYRIGPALYWIGSIYLSSTDFLKVIEPVAKTLNDLTGETILTGIFDSGMVIFVSKEESKNAFRFSSHIGTVRPAHASAMGRAFLSELTEAEVDHLYPQKELPRFTPHTIATKTDLKLKLEQIRKTGVSFTEEEFHEGAKSHASLIRDASGKAIASIGIPVQAFKAKQNYRNKIGELAKLGCSLVSYQLGYEDKVNPVRSIEEIHSWWEQNQFDRAKKP